MNDTMAARELMAAAKELTAMGSVSIAKSLLDDGAIGDYFRGEIGQPGCDNDDEWVAIAEELIRQIRQGISVVRSSHK